MKKGMKSKGYAKGGAKMMKAMGGRMMAKGYAKGSAKKGVKTKTMTLAQAKKVLKMNNMKAVKI